VSAEVAHLRLLGGFALRVDGRCVPVPPAGQRVLAYLALHGRNLTRVHLAGILWPDVRSGRAAANLRAAIWRAASPDVAVLVASRTHVRLDDSVVIDHEAALARARDLLDPAPATLDGEPAEIGELLPGWDADWLIPERERLRQLRLHALAEPLRESAQRCLIRAYLACGDISSARAQYAAYCALLAREFGVRPSPLAEAIVPELAGA
jgi:DNA-binding SARP family transcriptional activator